MTYLDYIVFLEKCDQSKALPGNAYKLYLKLLCIANMLGWPAEFAKSDSYVAAVCGIAENTMRECRTRLVAQGLLATVPGKMGRGATTVYQLLGTKSHSAKGAISEPLTGNKDSISDTLSTEKGTISEPLTPENANKVQVKGSEIEVLYIEEEKEESNTASAATSDFSEGVTKMVIPSAPTLSKSASRKPKVKGATHEEIAAIPLPHPEPEFAEAWRTFYTTNTKQAGKALSAFTLMLKKLGGKPAGFAVVQLEMAIMGDWSGVENGGTAHALAEWQAEQARNPAPAPTAASAPVKGPEMNLDFLAEQEAAAARKRAARLAELEAAS